MINFAKGQKGLFFHFIIIFFHLWNTEEQRSPKRAQYFQINGKTEITCDMEVKKWSFSPK